MPIRIVILLFALISFPNPVLSDNGTHPLHDRMIEEIRSHLTSPSSQQSLLQDLNIPKNHEPVYRNHLEQMANNDDFMHFYARRLTGLLETYQHIDKDEFLGLIEHVALTSLFDLFQKGLRRIPADQARFSLRVELEMIRNMDNRSCAAYFHGDISSQKVSKNMKQFMNTLSPDAARHYLSIQRNSVLAEIRNSPFVQILDEEQERYAEKILLSKLRDHPDSETLNAVLIQPRQYSDAQVCESMQDFMDVLLSGSSVVDDWILRSFLLDMSGS